ncbi:MAG: hypothetical protein CME65_13785 [Halobacteriovoraceae bacterium]|nr:hypothetical protein [Halobacteriovoraceae bacterium]|tara:strand:- start:9812 stop:12013 length:2202 start_codon:yes stop_codon:yes gene_type:complete
MIFEDIETLVDHISSKEVAHIDDLLGELDELRIHWSKGGKYYQKANELGIEYFEQISDLFSSFEWKNRLDIELRDRRALDDFVNIGHYQGRIHYTGLGRLLHITASNVALGMIDSLLMGVFTKNQNIVKLSDETKLAGGLIQESLKEFAPSIESQIYFINYRGGDRSVEDILFKNIDAVIAWGGESMVDSVSKRLPSHVKFIKHGPKISFHVISKEGLKELDYALLVQDITLYHQQACANSQNIYLEQGIDKAQFLKNIQEKWSYQRNTLDADSAVELLKESQLDLYREFKQGEAGIHKENLSISPSDNLFPEPTALNGHIRIKTFSKVEELAKNLAPFRPYLQTCGLQTTSLERDHYLKVLSHIGVNRFTSVGHMLIPMSGSPHDGEFNLLSLTTVATDEKSLDSRLGGFLYASGGTTGDPKFSFYSNEEFNQTAKILSEGFFQNGLTPGKRVGNLFAAGNLWSSFNAIQIALGKLNVIQLPFGAINDISLFSLVAKKFPLDAVFGLPSLLVDLAKETGGIKIPQVFYAGEPMTRAYQKVLKEYWGVETFSSAGYASVDAGPIGYQDPEGEIGDHILFSDYIELVIKEDQGYVTSKIKAKEAVIDYPTGDRIKILPAKGDGKIRFRLLGRADQKINIWSTRFELIEVEKILIELGMVPDFQIKLISELEGEYLVLVIKEDLKLESFASKLWELRDIRQTRDYDYLLRHVRIEGGNFLRNSRTGKIPKIVDLR